MLKKAMMRQNFYNKIYLTFIQMLLKILQLKKKYKQYWKGLELKLLKDVN
jgi:hypothetical protein